jgi:hypothetical protein
MSHQPMRTFLSCVSVVAVLMLSGCPAKPECKAGEQECPCIDGTSCAGALACRADLTCGAAVVAGVQFNDASARGCELVLTEAEGTEVANVEFKNGATGSWLRQAPKVAITVVAGSDTSLAGSVVLSLTGASSGLSVGKATCVDIDGHSLSSIPAL